MAVVLVQELVVLDRDSVGRAFVPDLVAFVPDQHSFEVAPARGPLVGAPLQGMVVPVHRLVEVVQSCVEFVLDLDSIASALDRHLLGVALASGLLVDEAPVRYFAVPVHNSVVVVQSSEGFVLVPDSVGVAVEEALFVVVELLLRLDFQT